MHMQRVHIRLHSVHAHLTHSYGILVYNVLQAFIQRVYLYIVFIFLTLRCKTRRNRQKKKKKNKIYILESKRKSGCERKMCFFGSPVTPILIPKRDTGKKIVMLINSFSSQLIVGPWAIGKEDPTYIQYIFYTNSFQLFPNRK